MKKTEEKLSQSQNEISKLSIRAATPFTELTPRPSFEPIFSLFSETNSNLHEKSTIDKTQIIYEKFKMILTSRSKQSKRDSISLSPPKKGIPKKQTMFSNNNCSLSIPHNILKKSQSKKSIKMDSSQEIQTPNVFSNNNGSLSIPLNIIKKSPSKKSIKMDSSQEIQTPNGFSSKLNNWNMFDI